MMEKMSTKKYSDDYEKGEEEDKHAFESLGEFFE